MRTSSEQQYPNTTSFLYVGHIPAKNLLRIRRKRDVHAKVVVYTPEGDTLTSEANRKRLNELVPQILEAVLPISATNLRGKTALVIREEAHGGQNIFELEK